MNRLRELEQCGQAVWLDYIRRNLLTSGELKRLIEEDGVTGVTSNPTIFDKAISGSSDYDAALRQMLIPSLSAKDAEKSVATASSTNPPRISPPEMFEKLEVDDIRAAADLLRPVYDRTGGADGYVSIEEPAAIAHDTAASLAEARRLWKLVNRPNALIKIPCTPEAIPAIEQAIAEGININITLMFSLAHYEEVAHAYLRGLRQNRAPQGVASVASFFVSRVDTLVDHALETIGTPAALALRGKIGIANCKQVYRRFQEIFLTPRFDEFKQRGARVQRVLWASTSTKNPAYPDTMYVEELIGPQTINTIPPATLKAFKDHGRPRASLEQGMAEAGQQIAQLAELGVDLNAIAQELSKQGIADFRESGDKLLASLEQKREEILGQPLDRQQIAVGPLQSAVDALLEKWKDESFAHRLSAKDYTLWAAQPQPELTDKMGWLTLPETMYEQADGISAFAQEIRNEGFRHVVLLGMGGSSLAPAFFEETFGAGTPGFPELIVLDSTHPDAVRAVDARIDLKSTLFVVSSKSGTTLEPLSFFHYFWERIGQSAAADGGATAGRETGATKAGRQFVAITDPGTPLEKQARERNFRRIFPGPPDVGGRYSALTVFGLVPAALIGVDIRRLLNEAWTMKESGEFCGDPRQCASLTLGAVLGEATLARRDKATFIASSSLAAFPSWVEQLIAESTGKDDKGIIPVVDEPLGSPEVYADDRNFIYMCQEKECGAEGKDATLKALENAGHPVVRITLKDLYHLGQEFFRWEVAVAAAGSVMGINPFNQPDVELAKQLARKLMDDSSIKSTASTKSMDGGDTVDVGSERLSGALQSWWKQARAGDYAAIQAYLAPNAETSAGLQEIRELLRSRSRLATTCGYGPRFLHSTGQLHKGGPNSGLFLQLVDEPKNDLAVPESNYTFGAIIRAQALGDYQALKQRGRRVLRVNLGGDTQAGLRTLVERLEDQIKS